MISENHFELSKAIDHQPEPDSAWLSRVQTWNDVVILSRLAGVIWREHYPPIIGWEQVEYMLDKFQSPWQIWQDIQQGIQYDLLLQAAETAGYMAAKADSSELFLSKFYLARPYRGRGLSRLMFRDLLIRCHKMNLKKIRLTVNRNNLDSIAAYQHLGFSIRGQTYQDIGDGYGMDDYVMQIDLS